MTHNSVPVLTAILTLQIVAWAGDITLTADKQSYLVGQPVYLRIEGESKIPLIPEAEYARLLIVKPDGENHWYRPPARFEMASRGGETVEYATLVLSRGGFIFTQAGDYVLQLYPGDPDDRTPLSKELVVSFRIPEDKNDYRARELIQSDPWGYALVVYLEGGDHIPGGMKVIEELASFESNYRGLGRFVMSCNWSRNHVNYSTNEVRWADPAKALSFAQCADTTAGAYMRMQNAVKLRRGLTLAERHDAGTAAMSKGGIGAAVVKAIEGIAVENSALYQQAKAVAEAVGKQ